MALFVINTISATKFSINGREMFKTFTPVYLNETRISVANIYDSRQLLFNNILVSEIEVDGIIYANATLLITALVPVIFIPAGEGSFSQAQIDQNTADILLLEAEKAEIDHNHNLLYYLKTEIDSMIAGLGGGVEIASGAVVNQNLVFYDALNNVLFQIDAKKFFEQGNNLTFSNGILRLENVFGATLSSINLNISSIAYDDFIYAENISTDFSNIIYENTFVLAKTTEDRLFFLQKKDSTFSVDEIRWIFEAANYKYDLVGITSETITYKAYELLGLTFDFVAGTTYRFDFRRNYVGIANIEGLQENLDLTASEIEVLKNATKSEANELIEKGFNHIENFDWYVFAQKYRWNGVLYEAPADLVTDIIKIDPAPTTVNFKRFDVPVFNIDLTFSIVKGDEGLNPAIPKIDPRTQLQLTVILVEYGTTEPSYLTKQMMYNEGLGLPTEFAVTKVGTSIIINNTEQASSGEKCIKVANPVNSDVLFLDKNATFNSLDVDTITFKVKNLIAGNWRFYLYSYNSIGGFYQGTATIKNGKYGYNSYNITDWQTVIVPISAILGTGEVHNTGFALTFVNISGGTFYFDEFALNGNFTQAPTVVNPLTYLELTDTDNTYTGHAGKVPKVNAGETALEFDLLDKSDVGLSNVDNTSDVNKPISTAQQTALDLKLDDSDALTSVSPTNKLITQDDITGLGGGDMLKSTYDPTNVNGDAFATNNFKNATVAKTTPIDADNITLWDSISSSFKKVTWANIKAALKTYFDGFYFPKYGTRITNATVTGTYTLNHSLGNDWKLTLTGITTIAESNLPTGTDTIEFTMKITGNFGLTVPAYWTVLGDAYDGTIWNFFTVQIHKGDATQEATCFISNF